MDTQPTESPIDDGCLNCGEPLTGAYCSSCGQRRVQLERPLHELMVEWLDAVASFDKRVFRTLGPLILKPGLLTVEYLAGRRARYVHPLRLFVALSVLLFVVLSITDYSMLTTGSDTGHVVTFHRETVTTPSHDNAPTAPDQNEPPAASDVERPPPSALLMWINSVIDLYENQPSRFNQIFIDRLAKAVFVLVPVVALLLRLLYRRSLYFDHLIFSLHIHSFGFLVVVGGIVLDLVIGTAGGLGSRLATVAIGWATYLALRRVQRQRRLVTLLKLSVLMAGYLATLLSTMAAVLVITTWAL